MQEINGYDNEYEFVKKLNGKCVWELDPLLRKVVDDLFPGEKEYSVIKCWRNRFDQKSDIFIRINGLMKGISIKKGSRNSVHLEPISNFKKFLAECGVSIEIINEYLKYHYADGTLNGHGKKRLSAEEYKLENKKSIARINEAFNKEDIIKKAITRFVIKGNNSDYDISGIIFGEIEDFLWINRKDIINSILSKKDADSSAVHFGSLICQPQNRCLNYNPKYEKTRHCVQIKWYSLFDDIIENMNKKIKIR